MSDYFVGFLASVQVTINDPDVVNRCVDNHNEDGEPQENGSRDGWRDMFYPLFTRDDVLEHLAYNCAANRVRQANQLDGWADLPDDAATMSFEPAVELERIVEAETA